ncbi:hypothetical protein F2Q69_00036259 [Brassica cretica]|uniref:Uncharacterized protein n=1 Tax=Brassica cretica TaxID=69181 RepID=A0A8S9SRH7_BRACR|nr:hypothetical protein F2Q69_00036259 [Brassica cretica]
MKSKPDLALHSSFISGSVRSKKQRSEAGPSESMDSSGSSLDLTAEVENPSRASADRLSSFAGGEGVGGVGDLSRSAKSSLLEDSDSPAESRYHLHPRGGELPVQEIVKKERKRLPVFDGRWTEKFAFMYLLCFSTVWCTTDIPSVDPSLGEKTIKQVLELPSQVPILCHASGNMSGSKGEEALAVYKRALEVMSAMKAAPKRAALSGNDDEVQFTRSNKRQAATALASSLKKKSKAPGSTPRRGILQPPSNSSRAMSQMFHLGERMGDDASLKADLAELTSQLREERDNVLAKEKEIKALKLKVSNQDEAGTLAAAENVSLREQLEQREEEVCYLRCAAETFDAEKTMAVRGTIVVAHWEMMREWLNHQIDSWDLEGALERYKMVKTSDAEFLGLPAPSFEEKPAIPG